MPVLRDLYSESKKSTSAYLPAYSLSIAAQPLSRTLAETTCITPSAELQCRRFETQNASRPAPVTVHRKPGGKRF